MTAETALETAPEREDIRHHLTPMQYEEIKKLIRSGQKTIPECATRFNVNVQALRRKLKRDKVEVDPIEVQAVAARSVDAHAEKELQERLVMIAETRRGAYALAKGVSALVSQKIAKAVQSGVPLANLLGEFKTLELASRINENTRQTRYTVLDMNKDTDPGTPNTQLGMVELTAEEAQGIQKQQNAALDFEETVDQNATLEGDTSDDASDAGQ